MKDWAQKKIKNVALLKKCMNYFKKLSFSQIVVILSIPFTPAFMMNIAAGIVDMDFKKYAMAVGISKIFLVYFWGTVGTGLVESFKNPRSLITVVIIMVAAYVLSFVFKKIFKID